MIQNGGFAPVQKIREPPMKTTSIGGRVQQDILEYHERGRIL